ncbi:Uncharacterised protein [Sphingobacterium spiritivorum]|uniref:DUF4836 family protein n=1 Tax=Sphingobacterium spiritivorum TaxID=258 RepID=A0A380BLE0_SPHSI|nr:hypothetical protein [Sphingobacterium spiritivorum]SUJ02676.1 Uncharacterised protein [Sphingobacterium spiritivorum]
MNMKFLLTVLISTAVSVSAYAQDLVRKIPADANLVVTLDIKKFFSFANPQDFNETLRKAGFFRKMDESNFRNVKNIEDLGINLSSQAYIYNLKNDSINYIGALIPLADAKKFGDMIPAHKKIEIVDGMQTFYSKDGETRVSWDNNTLYMLTGIITDEYFQQDSIAERYGLQSRGLSHLYDDVEVDSAMADTTYADMYDDVEVDTVMAEEVPEVEAIELTEEKVLAVPVSPPKAPEITAVPEIETPTGVPEIVMDVPYEENEEEEEDQTDYYKMVVHDDSIKSAIVSQAMNQRLSTIISSQGGNNFSNTGFSKRLNPNAIANIWVKSVQGLYNDYFPKYFLYLTTGFNPLYDSKFKFGLGELTANLVVEGNKLQLVADMEVDKSLVPYYKNIYKKKPNPKFYQYVDQNALGLVSANINTEAYLKFMPKYIEDYYGSLIPNYREALTLGTTLFDILLDEKAIAKVLPGDNLFVLNGVVKEEVKYTDYEYDEDYNSIPVERTKMEELPKFLWMFSSPDPRVFEQLLKLGIKEKAVLYNDGVYEFVRKRGLDINTFVLINNGIVFVGNDRQELKDIKDNKIHKKAGSTYTRLLKKNSFLAFLNTSRIPQILRDLNVPVISEMQETVNELEQYGPVYIASPGIKGNKISGEMSVEFPAKGKNAVSFIMGTIDSFLKTAK